MIKENTRRRRQPILNLWLVRHAEADKSVKALGLEPKLTDEGHKQAAALANSWPKRFQPDFFFSSNLMRAKQTADYIAKQFAKPYQIAKWLRETEADWSSYTVDRLLEYVDSHLPDGLGIEGWKDYPAPDMLIESYNRTAEGLDDLLLNLGLKRHNKCYLIDKPLSQTEPPNVLLLSHSGTTLIILSHLFNLHPIFTFFHFTDSLTSRFLVQFERWNDKALPVLTLYNHLPEGEILPDEL